MSYLKALRTPGRHETTTAKLFKGRVAFDGAAPVFDKPLIIMAFTNRCGSHLLGDFLRQTKKLAGFGEFLNHDIVARQTAEHGFTSFPEFITGLERRFCPEGQGFGLKASYDQMAMLMRWNIPAMFRNCKVLHITRQDTIAQAVSYSIAQQTQAWTIHQKTNGKRPVFDPKGIEAYIAATEKANETIRLLSNAAGFPRAMVTYEQICNDPNTHVGRVLPFCGVKLGDWVAHPPGVKKQGDGLNKEFVAAFHDLIRGAVLPR